MGQLRFCVQLFCFVYFTQCSAFKMKCESVVVWFSLPVYNYNLLFRSGRSTVTLFQVESPKVFFGSFAHYKNRLFSNSVSSKHVNFEL